MNPIPTAREWTTENVETLRADEPMVLAMRRLLGSRFLALPVVDEQRHIIGILTDKDCLRTASNWAFDQTCGGTVGDYMSPVKTVIPAEMDLLSVASVFLNTHFVDLPVCEEDVLVGMILRRDVLRGVMAWQRKHDLELQHDPHAAERPLSIEEMQRVVASHTREQVVSRFCSNGR